MPSLQPHYHAKWFIAPRRQLATSRRPVASKQLITAHTRQRLATPRTCYVDNGLPPRNGSTRNNGHTPHRTSLQRRNSSHAAPHHNGFIASRRLRRTARKAPSSAKTRRRRRSVVPGGTLDRLTGPSCPSQTAVDQTNQVCPVMPGGAQSGSSPATVPNKSIAERANLSQRPRPQARD